MHRPETFGSKPLDDALDRYLTKIQGSLQRFSQVTRHGIVGFSAAATAGLLSASQVEANIIYRVDGRSVKIANIPTGPYLSGFSIDMDSNGKFDFLIAGLNRGTSYNSTKGIAAASSYNFNGGLFKQSTNPTSFYSRLRALNSGSTIGSRTDNMQRLGNAAFQAGFPFGNNIFGIPISATGTGFIGGVFTSNPSYTGTGVAPLGEERYAWLRIQISTGARRTPLHVTLIDWAYESTGAPIRVGAVPEPASGPLTLMTLALGAAGLRRRRLSQTAGQGASPRGE